MVELTYKGVTLQVEVWAKIYDLNPSTIKGRIKRGWSAEKTLETPPMKTGGTYKGNWGGKEKKLKVEQITDESALSLCYGIVADIRKDIRERIKNGRKVDDLEKFFETQLAALMLECMGFDCEGRELFDCIVREVTKEVKEGSK